MVLSAVIPFNSWSVWEGDVWANQSTLMQFGMALTAHRNYGKRGINIVHNMMVAISRTITSDTSKRRWFGDFPRLYCVSELASNLVLFWEFLRCIVPCGSIPFRMTLAALLVSFLYRFLFVDIAVMVVGANTLFAPCVSATFIAWAFIEFFNLFSNSAAGTCFRVIHVSPKVTPPDVFIMRCLDDTIRSGGVETSIARTYRLGTSDYTLRRAFVRGI